MMKKLILGILSLTLLFNISFAQDGKGALRDATRAFGAFNLDQSANKGKLQEAVDAINIACEAEDTKGSAKTWQTKGEIYSEIATQIITVRQLGFGSEDELPKVEAPALQAFHAFEKAMELAEKKYETKDALKGIAGVQSNLYNKGIYAYEEGQYDIAYEDFKSVIDAHKILKNNGEASSLDGEGAYNDLLYLVGLAALNADKTKEAAPVFEELYKANYDKPAIYEALYSIRAAEDMEDAYKYIEAGRKKYPEDVSLLFAEINHFLKQNKLDELISKLKTAIEKEPQNISLYTTLGNVYDNLYQREARDGHPEKASEYFASAKEYYEKALEKDPKYGDAIYSLGALYYNRAASMTQELLALENDLTKEGLRKYEEKKKDIFAQFDLALPYFQRAEALDPNDVNTLIALKEIYARKDDLETSNEFKKRLETVQGGGQNASSYFKN